MRNQIPQIAPSSEDRQEGIREIIAESELLRQIPVSRRTLGTWKTRKGFPYIKIGRRCFYNWSSVQQWLLRQERNGLHP